MSRFILAIDPGKTTGWSMYDRDSGDFESGETNFNDTCTLLATKASMLMQDLLIVSESFIITAHTAKNTQAPWSLELIGVARYFSRAYTGNDLQLQAPSQAKRFSSDARLKHMGWYRPAKGHANDSARHLLLLLVSRGWLDGNVVKSLVNV